MEITEYTLEIYAPGATEDPILVAQSTTPFMTIRTGDIINPTSFSTFDFPEPDFSGVLRVVNVEHIPSRTEWRTEKLGIKQKICVFTKEEADTRNTRLS